MKIKSLIRKIPSIIFSAIKMAETTGLTSEDKELRVLKEIIPLLLSLCPGSFFLRPFYRVFIRFLAPILIKTIIHALNDIKGHDWINNVNK